MDRIMPGLRLKLLVEAGNRYFRKAFAKTSYNQRLFFLPICLRPRECPAAVDPDQGLCCPSTCLDCELGKMRKQALELGYAAVYIVPSSRLMRDKGLLPSEEFIKGKIGKHTPAAVLGITCDWYLKKRFSEGHNINRKGYAPGKDKTRAVLQGIILKSTNCRKAQVDWGVVWERMILRS